MAFSAARASAEGTAADRGTGCVHRRQACPDSSADSQVAEQTDRPAAERARPVAASVVAQGAALRCFPPEGRRAALAAASGPLAAPEAPRRLVVPGAASGGEPGRAPAGRVAAPAAEPGSQVAEPPAGSRAAWALRPIAALEPPRTGSVVGPASHEAPAPPAAVQG
jgi:hypothetical protein